MLKKISTVLLIAVFLKITYGKPASWILTENGLVPVFLDEEALSSVTGYCFTLSCPKGTLTCGKRSEVSEDRTVLNSEIQCLDGDENVLKAQNFTEPNPYDPSVYFKGMQISSVKRSRSFTETKWDDKGVVLPPKKQSKKETSQTTPKSDSGPKSEVEDLLGY